jgi:hypothetical protein
VVLVVVTAAMGTKVLAVEELPSAAQFLFALAPPFH